MRLRERGKCKGKEAERLSYAKNDVILNVKEFDAFHWVIYLPVKPTGGNVLRPPNLNLSSLSAPHNAHNTR